MIPTAPDTSAGSATVSSAPSLGDDIGRMLGEYIPEDGESPEPEATSAAGTTPAEPAPGTENEAASEPAVAGADATTAASDGTTPATPTEPAPTEDQDPFADTTPATFIVNGQPVTNEDIRVFKEGGAVIRPEALPNVLNKLSERESLFERNRAQSVEYQALNKATEWTDQQSGKTYSGPEAAIEMRIGNASLFAENQLLVQAITDPDTLARCLTTVQVPDGNGGTRERVVFSEQALAELRRENALNQREIAYKVREHYRGVVADASKPAPKPVDFAAQAPKLVALLAKDAQLDASVLTPDDRALLAEQLPFHTTNGLASVAWQNLAKRMMQDRAAQKQHQQTIATVATDATKKGLANMAAAARGVKPQPKPVTPPPAPKPQAEKAANEGSLWDTMERASANAMRSLR